MPKTKEQYEQIKNERIKEIYKHSLYLFATHGLAGVTSDQITKAVGCSHGLLYHYFRSKDELFHSLINNVALKIEAEIIKDVDFDQEPKELIKQLLDAYLNALRSPRDDFACTIYLLLNLYIHSKKVQDPQLSFRFAVFENFYAAIDKGKKSGVFVDYPTIELTVTVMSALKGLSYNRINLGHGNCTIPQSEIIVRMLLKKLK